MWIGIIILIIIVGLLLYSGFITILDNKKDNNKNSTPKPQHTLSNIQCKYCNFVTSNQNKLDKHLLLNSINPDKKYIHPFDNEFEKLLKLVDAILQKQELEKMEVQALKLNSKDYNEIVKTFKEARNFMDYQFAIEMQELNYKIETKFNCKCNLKNCNICLEKRNYKSLAGEIIIMKSLKDGKSTWELLK